MTKVSYRNNCEDIAHNHYKHITTNKRMSNNLVINDNKIIFVPYNELLKLIHHLSPTNSLRLYIEFRFATGCRGAAIDCITYEQIKDGLIAFRPGKNQKGWIYRKLSFDWIARYQKYRETDYQRSSWNNGTKLFHVRSTSFERYFHKLRPSIGGLWNHKRPSMRGGVWSEQYSLSLNGLRHSYITLRVAQMMAYLGSYHLALEEIRREMNHSEIRMTARYQVFIDKYSVSDWIMYDPWNLLMLRPEQKVLTEW